MSIVVAPATKEKIPGAGQKKAPVSRRIIKVWWAE